MDMKTSGRQQGSRAKTKKQSIRAKATAEGKQGASWQGKGLQDWHMERMQRGMGVGGGGEVAGGNIISLPYKLPENRDREMEAVSIL